MTNSTITTSGNRAPAAFIFNGGQASFTGSSLLAANNTAILVQDAGSTVNLTNTNIKSTGAVGYGLRVNSGATATMIGGSSTTEGRDGPALAAAGGSISATNMTLVTSGTDNAMGAIADLNGQITLTGGSVTTTGDSVRAGARAHGLVARNPGGILTATSTSVLTTGAEAFGGVADDGGILTLTGNSIRTEGRLGLGLFAVVEQAGPQFAASISGTRLTVETLGPNGYGIMAQQNFLEAAAVATVTNSTVTTHGANAHGLRAVSAGTVNFNNGTVLTEGVGAHGIHSRDNGSSVNIDPTTVLATGANAHGALAEAGGLVTGIDSSVRATGANGSALYLAGAPGFVSAAIFTGSQLTNVSAPTIAVGGHGNLTLTNSFAGGSGQWLRVGTINDFPPLTAPETPITGPTDPEGLELPMALPPPAALPVVPGLANITLSASTVNGSAFTAAGSVSNVTMVTNSVWNMTGSSNITNLDILASVVQFSAPTGPEFKILTLNGNLSGGGLFGMNTDLRRIEGDLLVIEGLGSGAHQLLIANRGGSPTGPGQALRVVQTTDGAAGARFTLANPDEQVEAGMYIYRLRLGNSQGNTPDPTAWYLVNEVGPSIRGNGTATFPSLSGEGRALVNTIAVLPSTWFEELDTLHQRMGELRLSFAPPPPPSAPEGKEIVESKSTVEPKQAAAPEPPGFRWQVWLRGYGRRLNAETDLGGRFHESLWGTMMGIDGSIRLDGSRLWLGAFGGYSRVKRDFGASGEGDTDSVFGGLYGTWITDSGWYLDAVGKVNRFDTGTHSVSNLGQHSTGGTHNWGFGLSLEGGKQFQFGRGGFIEPQIQVAYTRLTSDSYTTSSGIRVDVGDQDNFQLRAGVLAGWKFAGPETTIQPYLKASVVDTLSHGGRLNADGADFHATLDGVHFEGGAGIMAQLGTHDQLYVDYTAAVGDKIEQPWSVNVGFRHAW